MARAADRLAGELRYGDRIRLATESCYISPRRWGYLGWYEKHHRLQFQNKGILSVISPLWIEEKDAGGGHDDGFDENAAFVASEFTVVSAKNERSSFGKRVQWGDRLLLVDQNGLILNNKPAGSRSITITGYVGPRERGKRGEMHVCFTPSTQVSGAVAPALVARNDRQDNPPSDHDDADSDGHESGDEDGDAHPHGGASRSAGGGWPAPCRPGAPSPAPLPVQEVPASLSHLANTDSKYVHYGDHVHIDVPWSRRFRTGYNKRLTNFKKESSHIAGGYVCCDGHGGELSFTILPAAEAMWRAHIAWRQEYQLDDPIEGPLAWDEERPAEGILCAEWYPVGRHGRDYQGRPVVFIRAGHVDIPGIVEQAGLPVLIKHCVVQQMRLLQSLRAASFRTGNMRFGAIIVMDMKGLGRRHFKALKLFNEVKKVSSRRI
eukprot:g177.t1